MLQMQGIYWLMIPYFPCVETYLKKPIGYKMLQALSNWTRQRQNCPELFSTPPFKLNYRDQALLFHCESTISSVLVGYSIYGDFWGTWLEADLKQCCLSLMDFLCRHTIPFILFTLLILDR